MTNDESLEWWSIYHGDTSVTWPLTKQSPIKNIYSKHNSIKSVCLRPNYNFSHAYGDGESANFPFKLLHTSSPLHTSFSGTFSFFNSCPCWQQSKFISLVGTLARFPTLPSLSWPFNRSSSEHIRVIAWQFITVITDTQQDLKSLKLREKLSILRHHDCLSCTLFANKKTEWNRSSQFMSVEFKTTNRIFHVFNL